MKGVGRTIRRRRKEAKTDYKSRLGLLKSNKNRVIVRKTNRYIIGQIVKSDVANDKVIVGVNSKELLEFGWPQELKGSLKGLASCYLTGYLLGKKVEKDEEFILDIGLQRSIKKSRVYAFLKGFIDYGMKIPYDEKALPSLEELNKNEKTKDVIGKVMEKMK